MAHISRTRQIIAVVLPAALTLFIVADLIYSLAHGKTRTTSVIYGDWWYRATNPREFWFSIFFMGLCLPFCVMGTLYGVRDLRRPPEA